MRILAFGDLHENADEIEKVIQMIKKSKPDVLVSIGDMVNYKTLTEAIFALGNECEWICVHGNNDNLEDIRARIKTFSKIKYLDWSQAQMGDLTFGGFGGVIGKKSRNFSMEELKQKLSSLSDIDILVTHLDPESGGGDILLKHIEKSEIKYWFHGHKHVSGGDIRKIGKTMVINASKPVVVEILAP